jgi:two-component system NarL family sensor kinase
MVILISDNGRGVSASQADLTGVGMLNMKQRLQIIGGEFKVENNPAGGTAVAMQMPRKWSV